MNKVYKTFSEWMEEIVHNNLPRKFLYHSYERGSAEEGWQARQAEIDELKSRISELESDNEELKHILRQNDSY